MYKSILTECTKLVLENSFNTGPMYISILSDIARESKCDDMITLLNNHEDGDTYDVSIDVYKEYVSAVKNSNMRFLYIACMQGESDYVKLLLDHGYDIYRWVSDYGCPLDVTCRYGNNEVLLVLLDYNVDIQRTSRICMLDGCKYGHIEIVKTLLMNGSRFPHYHEKEIRETLTTAINLTQRDLLIIQNSLQDIGVPKVLATIVIEYLSYVDVDNFY
jgi:hypothetical protein